MSATPRGPRGESSRLNRVILLLNVGVLVVNFLLAFQTTDSQIGLLRATVETGNSGVRRARTGAFGAAALPSSRVLQSLENISRGQEAFAPAKLQAIYDAVAGYQSTMKRGVIELVFQARDGANLRDDYARLGKSAREEVEHSLATHFDDPAAVRRLATEVIRACR